MSVKMASISFLQNIIILPYSPFRQHTDRLAESDMDDGDNDNDDVQTFLLRLNTSGHIMPVFVYTQFVIVIWSFYNPEVESTNLNMSAVRFKIQGARIWVHSGLQ